MNFDFALSPSFVVWYCIAIGIFWTISVGWLTWQAGRLGIDLRRLNRELPPVGMLEGKSRTTADDGNGESAQKEVLTTRLRNGFVEGFEEYNRTVSGSLGLTWKEFVETLILPAPDSGDPIRNTGEVSRYLNDDTVIFPHVSFGFYQSVPNLLTGIGILGTFFGLAAGVGSASVGLSSNDPTQITNSLQHLLSGASLAFLTSIAGVSGSILFLVVERLVSRQLHLELDEWVGAIELRLERVTPEAVALKQLEEAKESTRQLVKFNTELIFSIEQALDEKIAGDRSGLGKR